MSHFVTRERCPACDGPGATTLYACDFTEDPVRQYLVDFYNPQGGVDFGYLAGGHYELRGCSSCALVYQRQVLGPEGMTLLYERWIDPDRVVELYEKEHTLRYYRGYVAASYAVTAYLAAPPSTLRYFDFGMGWGNWLLAARAFGVNVFGAELSERRAEHARRHGITVLAWDEIPGQMFDYINTDQVFEHIPDPIPTLAHLVSGLRPGGLIRLCVPDGNRHAETLRVMDWQAPRDHPHSLNMVAPLEHINCYSTSSLLALAATSGLEWVPMSKFPRVLFDPQPSMRDKLAQALQLPGDAIRKLGLRRSSRGEPERPWGTDLYFTRR